MKIIEIYAKSKNNAIGIKGTLPWHLPDDFQFFKEKTLNKTIVMGRRTWESLGKPLKNRIHIVISHDTNYHIDFENVYVVHSLNDAIELAKTFGDELWVTGGSKLYHDFLPLADEIYVTNVNCTIENADTFVDPIDETQFVLADKIDHPIDEKHKYSFSFEHYIRSKQDRI